MLMQKKIKNSNQKRLNVIAKNTINDFFHFIKSETMENYKTIILSLIVIITLISCSVETPKSEISPAKGATLIIGQIVSIDTNKFSTDQNSPCSKLPCWAKVKIDSVLNVGQGGPMLNKGDTVNTQFVFTLSETTKELFPNLKVRMPGLKINSSFKANIRNVWQGKSLSESKFRIQTYHKL